MCIKLQIKNVRKILLLALKETKSSMHLPEDCVVMLCRGCW
jgi:hypothetical protein